VEEEEEEGVADVNVGTGTGVEERERLGEYGPTSRLDFFWPAILAGVSTSTSANPGLGEREGTLALLLDTVAL
jgi:hypothetical protein